MSFHSKCLQVFIAGLRSDCNIKEIKEIFNDFGRVGGSALTECDGSPYYECSGFEDLGCSETSWVWVCLDGVC